MRLICFIIFILTLLVSDKVVANKPDNGSFRDFNLDLIFSIDEIEKVIKKALIDSGAGNNVGLETIRIQEVKSGVVFPLAKIISLNLNHQFTLSKFDFQPASNRFEAIILAEDTLSVTPVIGKVFNIQGKYRKMVEVPILSKMFHRGDVVKEEDIEWVFIPEKMLRQDVLLESKEIIGKAATRVIRSGNVVRKRDLKNPVLVTKGSIVPVFYRTKYMELKTLAHALDSGGVGDVIRLKNLRSGSIVKAMIKNNSELVANYTEELASSEMINNGQR